MNKPSRPSAPPARRMPAPPPPPVAGNKVISNKTFSVQEWTGSDQGEKIIAYGRSGIGKTTCAAVLEDAVWLGIDDGGRKIRNPVTGEPLKSVPEVETFDDVRAVLQSGTLNPFKNIVIDTITELQEKALPATFKRVPASKGVMAQSIEDYGYHKGYRHWYDTMRLILGDCDRHIREGRNIIMLAQSATIKWANPSGEDFLVEAPDLYHDKDTSILDAYVSWADHVLRIGYASVTVEDHKATGTAERAVFVHPQAHFIAKSRTVPVDYDVVEFKQPGDDSIWRLIFGGHES